MRDFFKPDTDCFFDRLDKINQNFQNPFIGQLRGSYNLEYCAVEISRDFRNQVNYTTYVYFPVSTSELIRMIHDNKVMAVMSNRLLRTVEICQYDCNYNHQIVTSNEAFIAAYKEQLEKVESYQKDLEIRRIKVYGR
jgi:hypothetical protein